MIGLLDEHIKSHQTADSRRREREKTEQCQRHDFGSKIKGAWPCIALTNCGVVTVAKAEKKQGKSAVSCREKGENSNQVGEQEKSQLN